MNGIEAIKASLETTRDALVWYVDDFTDADLRVRPVAGANNAAWQIGNVIAGDIFMVKGSLPDASFPELPAGFDNRHGSAGASIDGPEGLLTKDEYLALFSTVRAATIAALEGLTEADLDRPTEGSVAAYAPTLGLVFLQTANHTLMHAGQFTVIRRLLGKPVLF